MLEILQFVFSSFWIWLGTVVLLSVIAGAVIGTFDRVIASLALLRAGGR